MGREVIYCRRAVLLDPELRAAHLALDPVRSSAGLRLRHFCSARVIWSEYWSAQHGVAPRAAQFLASAKSEGPGELVGQYASSALFLLTLATSTAGHFTQRVQRCVGKLWTSLIAQNSPTKQSCVRLTGCVPKIASTSVYLVVAAGR